MYIEGTYKNSDEWIKDPTKWRSISCMYIIQDQQNVSCFQDTLWINCDSNPNSSMFLCRYWFTDSNEYMISKNIQNIYYNIKRKEKS